MLRTLTRFRNPDLTSDLNHRLRNLVSKGVFFGGQVLPVAGTLDVQVQPFASAGADGMVTILEGAAQTLTLIPGVKQHVVLHAYYVADGPAVATLEVLTQADYASLGTIGQTQRVIVATATLSPTATEVTLEDILYTEADRVDPVARSQFRGAVSQVADLPDYTNPATGATTQNRTFDIFFVEQARVFYHWTDEATPRWQPIISAAEEFALSLHKLNQDDGTVPPDFYEAQHVTVDQREVLDAGSASEYTHGAEGVPLGATNPVVDLQYPVSRTTRVDVTGLSGVTQFQLPGKFYVGTGGFGTATPHFVVTQHETNRVLHAVSNNKPIRVGSIRRSDNPGFELAPSADADALGFYENPYIRLDLTEAGIASYTGDLSVICSIHRGVGTEQPGDDAVGTRGVGLVVPARDIPVSGVDFDAISTGTDDVQEALENLDQIEANLRLLWSKVIGVLPGAATDPDELRWWGGQPAAIGYLEQGANSAAKIRAVTKFGGRPMEYEGSYHRFIIDNTVDPTIAAMSIGDDGVALFNGADLGLIDGYRLLIAPGNNANNIDIKLITTKPGFVLNELTEDVAFRWGVRNDLLQLSIDTDGDDTRDSDGHLDDVANAVVIKEDGFVGLTTTPLARFHAAEGASGISAAETGAVGLFESDTNTYVQVSSPDTLATGVLLGGHTTPTAGGVVWRPGLTTPSLGLRAATGYRAYVTQQGIQIGAADPLTTEDAGLEVVHSNGGLVLISDTTADNATQSATIATPDYLGTTPVVLMRMGATATDHKLRIGGNGPGWYAATNIGFYTAPDVSTAGGTQRVYIDESGRVAIGTTSSPLAQLHVYKSDTTGNFRPNTLLGVEAAGSDAFISILTDNSSTGGLVFADAAATSLGGVYYDHATDKLALNSGAIDRVLVDAATGDVTFTNTAILPAVHPTATGSHDIGSTALAWRRVFTEAVQLEPLTAFTYTTLGDLSLVNKRPYVDVDDGNPKAIAHTQTTNATTLSGSVGVGATVHQSLNMFVDEDSLRVGSILHGVIVGEIDAAGSTGNAIGLGYDYNNDGTKTVVFSEPIGTTDNQRFKLEFWAVRRGGVLGFSVVLLEATVDQIAVIDTSNETLPDGTAEIHFFTTNATGGFSYDLGVVMMEIL